MTRLILTAAALLFSLSTFAASNPLVGKTYCRTVVSNGGFGQPKGEKLHCISFDVATAHDNANSFFGGPPETAPYVVRGRIVAFGKSKYVLAKDLSDIVAIAGSVTEGTVLTLK